jgi:hypothetical protein
MGTTKRGGPRLQTPITGKSSGVLGKKRAVPLPMAKSYKVSDVCKDNVASLQPKATKIFEPSV